MRATYANFGHVALSFLSYLCLLEWDKEMWYITRCCPISRMGSIVSSCVASMEDNLT